MEDEKKEQKDSRIKSTNFAGVVCAIGTTKRTPSTITMNIDDDFVLEAVQLFKTIKKGEKPTKGLIGLQLHAVYAGDEEEAEKLIVGMGDGLEEVTGEGE